MGYVLKTDRLTLWPMTLRDLESVYAYAFDIENTKYR